jgi:hypothetical protein
MSNIIEICPFCKGKLSKPHNAALFDGTKNQFGADNYQLGYYSECLKCGKVVDQMKTAVSR